MKVQLLVARVTLTEAQNRGDIVEVTKDEAKRMIEAGQASPVATGVKPEKAVKK